MPDPMTTPTPPLPVEETPEIPMETPEVSVQPPTYAPPPPPPMPNVSWSGTVAIVCILLVLVGAGMWFSGFLRMYLPFGGEKPVSVAPTGMPAPDPFATWKTYPVMMGSSTNAGLLFKLPPDVLAPTCDGVTCASQGTYLPGGTRFTIAPRGYNQALTAVRGALVTDANGVAFVDKDATISGHIATEFFGTFTGRTITGYGFTQMRGYMIEVSPTLSLEINHFAPTGIQADFAKDDVLFDQIVSTLNFSAAPSPSETTTPILLPTVTTAPIATTTPAPATTSGY